MQIHKNTNVERIIAKIDNDFNPDNTDWIPRVSAWIIDALSMLKCLDIKRKNVQLPVNERIVYASCGVTFDDTIEVCDDRGCKVEENNGECCSYSTGEIEVSNTIEVVDTGNDDINAGSLAFPVNMPKYPPIYAVEQKVRRFNKRTYIIIDSTKLELNFDSEFVTVRYNGVDTYMSLTYNCEIPVIPNNGLLIEALVYYCMYKMLCRGYKHPVFNLQASQYGTNPYFMWEQLKSKAKASVIAGVNEVDDKHAWDNAMVDFMFK